jgi:hypothetical protein
VQIVEHQQQGLTSGCGTEPGGDRVEEPVALGLGIGPPRRGQIGPPLGDLGNQADELPAMPAKPLVEQRRRGVVDELAEGLDEGLVRDPEILVAAPGQHHLPLGVHMACELGGQARLPDPGLTGQHDHPGRSPPHVRPQLRQAPELGGPSHEDTADLGEQRRHRHLSRGGR